MLMTRMFSLKPGIFGRKQQMPADDQIDVHVGAGSFIKFLDNLLIDE